MRVARRILLPALAFFLVAMAAMGGAIVLDVNRVVDGLERRELAQLRNLFESRLETLGNIAKTMASYVAHDPEVRRAFAAGDRERLRSLTIDAYGAAAAVTAIPQFQFHHSPAVSFLRVHNPDRFGDDLSAFRFTVLAANRERRVIGGLEIGRAGLGMRGVVPVSDGQGGHLGSVEFGLDVDQFLLGQLARQSGAQWQLLLAREPAAIATFQALGEPGPLAGLLLQASTLSRPVYADADLYRAALAGEQASGHVSHDGTAYSLLLLPLRDFSGKVIAVVEILRDRSDLVAAQRERVLLGAGVVGGVLLLGALVMVVVVSRVLAPIRPLTRQALAVAEGQLTVTEAIDPRGRDEIGQLASAVQQMGRQLVESITHLELQVAARTNQLEGAYQQIRQLNEKLTGENLRMSAELDVSRQLQKMLLPTAEEVAGITPLDIATFMEPAAEVGGDYYDILSDSKDNSVRIGIGDVAGHGLESGVVMLMTQSAVRTLVSHNERDTVRLMDALNRTLYENIRRLGGERNLTLALLEYRPGDLSKAGNPAGRLHVTGQHESVVVVRRDGRVETIDTLNLGMPMGLIDDVVPYVGEAELDLFPADVVVLYTDGITEAADPDHRLYGLERMCDVVVRHRSEPAEIIKTAVINDVRRHMGGQTMFDDITLIVLKQR